MEVVMFLLALTVFIIAKIGDDTSSFMKYHKWQKKFYDTADQIKSIGNERRSTLQEFLNGQTPTHHNFLLEFDEAMRLYDEMLKKYEAEHPPGSAYDEQVVDDGASMHVYHMNMTFPPGKNYHWYVHNNFRDSVVYTYKEPWCSYGGGLEVRTWYLSPIMYCLGLARYEVIKHGYLPSNVYKDFGNSYSPYIPAPTQSGYNNVPGDIVLLVRDVICGRRTREDVRQILRKRQRDYDEIEQDHTEQEECP